MTCVCMCVHTEKERIWSTKSINYIIIVILKILYALRIPVLTHTYEKVISIVDILSFQFFPTFYLRILVLIKKLKVHYNISHSLTQINKLLTICQILLYLFPIYLSMYIYFSFLFKKLRVICRLHYICPLNSLEFICPLPWYHDHSQEIWHGWINIHILTYTHIHTHAHIWIVQRIFNVYIYI